MTRGRRFGALGVCALALGSPLAAEAGGGLVEPASVASAWTFDGGLYGWVLWVGGDVTARGEKFNVYADPIDLIDALDGPIVMANFEATRGRFSFYADVVYAKFAMESDFVGEAEPIPALKLTGNARIGADYTFGVYQADAFYQVADFAGPNGGRTSVELGAGARYIEQELNITAAIDVNARIQLGRLANRLKNRINLIENQEERLEALAQFNALRTQILETGSSAPRTKGSTGAWRGWRRPSLGWIIAATPSPRSRRSTNCASVSSSARSTSTTGTSTRASPSSRPAT